MSFFEKYISFEDQVNAAIEKGDAQLVQILLGPKYCQLWQYWLVHGIVSSKLLNMQNIVHSKLFLSIANKQMRVLKEQKSLLEEQQNRLKNADEKDPQISNQNDSNPQIKKSRHFIRDLCYAIRDGTMECQNIIMEESNKQRDHRSFYVPSILLEKNEPQYDVADNLNELHYLIEKVSTISSAEKLTLITEVNNAIKTVADDIENKIWEESDVSTRTQYYLDKVVHEMENLCNDENTRALYEGLNVISYTGNYLPLSCVENHLKEIERFIEKIENMAIEKQNLSDKVIATCNKIENQLIQKMNDGKVIDKQFVKDMYKVLLYNYLNRAKVEQSSLLHYDVMQNDINVVADKILTNIKEVDYGKFEKFLCNELEKSKANVDIINVLVVNSTSLNNYMNPKASMNLERLLKKSFHTIMIDVHNLLFKNVKGNYPDIDVDIDLVSFLPNEDGSYTQSCKNNIVVEGNKRYQKFNSKIKEFMDEIERLTEVGGLNRERGYFGIASLWYSFVDFLKGVTVGYTPNSEKDHEIIDEKIKEFKIKIAHSIAVGNEAMMSEYIEDVRSRMKNEQNSDVLELYKIVTENRWRDIFYNFVCSKDEINEYRWKSIPDDQKVENFMKITNQRIRASRILEEKSKRYKAEEDAEYAKQKIEKEIQRGNFIEKVSSIFSKKVYCSSMDGELKGIMFQKQNTIVREIVEYTMKHNSSPEEILDRVIENIKMKYDMNNIPIPDFMFIGKAMKEGDCFFDAVVCGIKEIRPYITCNVKSLREMCKSFAQKELGKDKSWLKEALNKEGQTIEQYIPRIEYDSDDIRQKEKKITLLLTSPIWGRPDIEGKIICEEYKIRLHVIEYQQLVNGWIHQIVNGSHSKSIDEDCIHYNEDDLIHIINNNNLHFDPILNKKKSLNPNQVVGCPFDEIIEESMKESFN